MTQETLDKAIIINHDIEVLKRIKYEQDKNHCVSFNTPISKEDSFWNSTMQDDFQNFIAIELVRAQKMLEEL